MHVVLVQFQPAADVIATLQTRGNADFSILIKRDNKQDSGVTQNAAVRKVDLEKKNLFNCLSLKMLLFKFNSNARENNRETRACSVTFVCKRF